MSRFSSDLASCKALTFKEPFSNCRGQPGHFRVQVLRMFRLPRGHKSAKRRSAMEDRVRVISIGDCTFFRLAAAVPQAKGQLSARSECRVTPQCQGSYEWRSLGFVEAGRSLPSFFMR
jgi:hypothetical protein